MYHELKDAGDEAREHKERADELAERVHELTLQNETTLAKLKVILPY